MNPKCCRTGLLNPGPGDPPPPPCPLFQFSALLSPDWVTLVSPHSDWLNPPDDLQPKELEKGRGGRSCSPAIVHFAAWVFANTWKVLFIFLLFGRQSSVEILSNIFFFLSLLEISGLVVQMLQAYLTGSVVLKMSGEVFVVRLDWNVHCW